MTPQRSDCLVRKEIKRSEYMTGTYFCEAVSMAKTLMAVVIIAIKMTIAVLKSVMSFLEKVILR